MNQQMYSYTQDFWPDDPVYHVNDVVEVTAFPLNPERIGQRATVTGVLDFVGMVLVRGDGWGAALYSNEVRLVQAAQEAGQ